MIRALVALLVGGTLLSAPALAASTPGTPIPGVEEAITAGDAAKAGDLLLAVIDDPSKSAQHGAAWLRLGDLLDQQTLPYPALYAYSKAIQLDAAGAAPKIKRALDLADQVEDTRLLAPALAVNVGVEADPETRSRLALLAAKYHLEAGNLPTALGTLMLVDKAGKRFGPAEMLRGVVLTRSGRPLDALAPFLTAAALRDQAEDPERFENALALDVARAYYAAENFPRAIEYYAKVERESPYWVDATFERAWAHFRLEDPSGSLGLLESFRTPFLDGYSNPEADLLRLYSMFVLCKFPSAGEEIERFVTKYTPRLEAFDREIPQLDAAGALADVAAQRSGGPTRLPAVLLRRFANEDRMRDAGEAIRNADIAAQGLQARTEGFAVRAKSWMEQRKAQIVAEEGGRVLAEAAKQRASLDMMLQGSKLTRVDILQYQTNLLERAAVTGVLEFGDEIGELRKLRKRKGTRLWPFEGEYWADEVGYYQYNLRPECPDDMKATGPL